MNAKKEKRLSLVFTPGEVQDGLIRNATLAVVDVLRATSVIPRAFASGAARVIPAGTVEQATGLLASLDRKTTLLCGEREGKKIQGFHLGNSPLEYEPDAVRGKTLIFSSTNGSQAMIRCLAAPEQVLASFVNASAAARRLAASDRDVVVVCAGREGRSSLEDTVMGGLLVERLLEERPDLRPDDGALMARTLWKGWRSDIPALLRTSAHGAYLRSLGFEADLDFCAGLDTLSVVPVLRDGRIEPEPGGDDPPRPAGSR